MVSSNKVERYSSCEVTIHIRTESELMATKQRF